MIYSDKKNVGFYALYNYDVNDLDEKNIALYTGNNSGNLLFRECLYNMLDLDSINLFDYFKINDDIKNKLDYLFIGCANIISNIDGCIHYIEQLINLIKNTNQHTEIILISLGQQLLLDFDFKNLNSITIQFIELITSRMNTILVRDILTYKIIEYYKKTNCNIIVTGCPSIFCNLKKNHNTDLQNNLIKLLNKTEINILYSPQTINDDIYNETTKWINRIFNNYKINIKLLIADYYGLDKTIREKYKNEIYYSSVKDCFNNYTPDIIITNRIHSCILGLTHSIPSIMISHDSRTQLLADFLKIPNIYYTNLDNNNLELKSLNYDKYCDNKLEQSKVYINYFNKICIPMNKYFIDFSTDYCYHNYKYPKLFNKDFSTDLCNHNYKYPKLFNKDFIIMIIIIYIIKINYMEN